MTMQAFTSVEGIAALLRIDNIDTDSIIPSRETQSVSRDGYGEKLFANWRYAPGTRIANPDFVLNKSPFDKAVILLAGANFGCGSSREAAVWSLKQFGIRAIVAESFGAIFYNNCIRNGVLPVVLAGIAITQAAQEVEKSLGLTRVCVDLRAREVRLRGLSPFAFDLAERDRAMLLSGTDEIALTLERRAAIDAWRLDDRRQRPWLYQRTPVGSRL